MTTKDKNKQNAIKLVDIISTQECDREHLIDIIFTELVIAQKRGEILGTLKAECKACKILTDDGGKALCKLGKK